LIVTAIASNLVSDLQQIVDATAAKYNCSVSLGIRMPGDETYTVAGGIVVADGSVAAKPTDKYAWGSVTKTITGAAILRRVADGHLGLDDNASTYIDPMLKAASYPYPTMKELFSADHWSIPPAVQYPASDVTIRHLLHMVSGIPDYDTDAYRHLQYTHAATGFSPLDIFDYVHGPLMFKPGGPIPSSGSHKSSTNYCSVNFILLGMVLANRAGAKSWDAYEQSEILPTALKWRIQFAGLDDLCDLTAPVHGYDRQSYAAMSSGGAFDVSAINCLGGWTAGNVVMDAQAAADWTYALFGPDAEVIPADFVKAMVNFTSYGLATFNFDGRYANGTRGVSHGHLGDTYGFTSTVAYFPAVNVSIAVATNLEEGQAMPSEVNCLAYNRLLDEIDGRSVPRQCQYATQSYYGGKCECSG